MKILNKGIFAFIPLLLFAGFVKGEEGKSALSIDEVLTQTKFRQKVFTVGVVKKAINFDDFILTSDQGALVLVRFKGIKQDLKAGDNVFVYGRHLGRPAMPGVKLEIEAIEYALDTQTENRDKLLSKYGVPTKIETPVVTSTETIKNESVTKEEKIATESPSVEDRLKKLDVLKQKALISEEEYKEQRKRILESL